ncbi:MAG: MATE family efflux transporter [Pseudomonadota bacterium]
MAARIALDGHRTPLRAEIRATLALALPLILGNFAQNAINTTDIIMLGRYDVGALAASALGVNLYFALAMFAVGLVMAASPLIAAARGKRAHPVRDARRTVRQAIWLSAMISLPIWLIIWNTEAVMLLFGQQPGISSEAASYNRITMWGMLPFLIFVVLRLYVSALERPIWGVIVTVIGVGFNIVADWLLIFGPGPFPELGLEGAAIASVMSNLVLMLGMIIVTTGLKPFRRYRLLANFWRSDWPRLWHITKLGVPIAIMLTLEVTIFSAAIFLMGLIDRDSVAAHAIALQIAAIAFMIPLGLSQAATVRVGYYYGREDRNGIRLAGQVAYGLGVGAAMLLALIMIAVPGPLVSLFMEEGVGPGSRVFDLAVSFLFIAAMFQLADGVQAVGAGVLRGLQDTRWPMIFAGFGYWVVGIGVAVGLGFYAGMEGIGIWIGLAAGLGVAAILLTSRWMLRERIGLVEAG